MSSRTIARNSALTAVDMTLGTVLGLVASVLVGRLLGPDKLGHFNYILWIASFSLSLATFGVPEAVGKYAAEFLGSGQPFHAAACIRLGFRYQATAGVAVLVLGSVAALLTEAPPHLPYVLLVVASLPFAMSMSVCSYGNMAMERFDANVIPSLVSSTLNVAGVFLSLWLGWDLVGLAASLLVSRIVDFCLRYILFRRLFGAYLREHPDQTRVEQAALPPELKQRFIRFCIQSTALMLINLVVWNRSEFFFLNRFWDSTQIAFYSISFGLVKALLVVTEPFSSAVGASLMIEYARDRRKACGIAVQFLRYQALAIVPLAFGVAALGRTLLLLTYGPAYLPATPVVTVAALLAVPAVFVRPVHRLIAAADRQSFLIRWGVVAAIGTLSLDWVLVKWAAAVGAAWANGLAQGVAVVGAWVFVVRRFGVRPPYKTIAVALAAGTCMALVVGLAFSGLPPLLHLLVGVPVGAGVYLGLVRLLGAMNGEDFSALSRLAESLPAWAVPAWLAALRFLVPGGPMAGESKS